MYDHILVPTDGGKQALRAVEHGCYLAAEFDARLHVLYVVDSRVVSNLLAGDDSAIDPSARLEAAGRQAIDDIRERVPPETTVRATLQHGVPTEAILRYIDEFDIDLLAMGTHGRTGVDRFVTGSVTEQVVRHAAVPVLTARVTDRSDVSTGYHTVLVPTDGSDAATVAIEHGLAIADKTGAKIRVLNVVEADNVAEAEETPLEKAARDLEAHVEEATDEVTPHPAADTLDIVTEVREGYPDEEIVDFADANDVDLIVMGTTGRTGTSRYLVGSTTERVIRHAHVAVLAVNARDVGDA